MSDRPDYADHLALALVPGLGPRLTAALLAKFGSAGAVLRATAAELLDIPHIGEKLATQFAAALRTIDISQELELLRRHGVRPVPLGWAGYPPPLAAVPAPPPLLYMRGEWIAADTNAVAIVGSRSCTPYGRRMTEQIARGLVRAGFCIVSGLARGIDGVAHRAALDAGGRTIAVLAGGLSAIYPLEHTDLADEVAKHGALISETPMTVPPQPGMFPARNRIISGLSRAVVVVEANAKSGALITATHAGEQGREVFAVPGNADSSTSAGCLELIRKGARLVRSADDVIEDLQGLATADNTIQTGGDRQVPVSPRPLSSGDLFQDVGEMQEGNENQSTLAPSDSSGLSRLVLDAAQQRVFDALVGKQHVDELVRELGVTTGELMRTLMQLELKKVVRRLPGNYYERR